MNSIKNINRLYNAVYNTVGTVNGTLSYHSVTSGIIALSEMVASTETYEFTLQEIGEFNEFCLADLIVGAYWHYTENHKGQDSIGYAALSSLSRLYWPNMETGPEEGAGENSAYEMLNQLLEGAVL